MAAAPTTSAWPGASSPRTAWPRACGAWPGPSAPRCRNGHSFHPHPGLYHPAHSGVMSVREGCDLHGWLVQVLRRRAPGFSDVLTDDTPLTEGGLGLDSLALMDLIAEIETTLGLRLQAAEISAENFGTP